MLGGRDGNHHAQALSGRLLRRAAAGATLAAAWLATTANADVQKIAPDGTVHRVDVEQFLSGGKVAGTALRHTRQMPGGAKDSSLVPGTDDPAVDREPALEIDPVTGAPLLVWSRNEGAGFDIVLSRFEGASWLPFVRVSSGGEDESQPQIGSGQRLVHVVYRQSTGFQGVFQYYRWSLDRATLGAVYGPEQLPLDGVPLVPPEGESSAGSDAPPTGAHVFFSGDLPALRPGDPGRIVVWGVRDDPVPVGFRQGFLLPADVKSVQQHRAGWLACRFGLWFTTSGRFYYTTRVNGRWHEDRFVETSSGTAVSDARLQLEEMIQKADGCGGP